MIELGETLFDQETISSKVGELAERISRDYAGRKLLLVSILKGAVIFTADLMRMITIPVEVEFISVSSYGPALESSGEVTISKDLDVDIAGKHVLLVDTIVDTGETIDSLLRLFAGRKPASIQVVVLLDKKDRRKTPVPLAYRGFEIPNKFVVGYGLDCEHLYRNLPYIAEVFRATQ